MAMKTGSTVYDRLKKTGYITGPRHRMNPGMEDMQGPPAPPDSGPGADEGDGDGDEGSAPPNLRDSTGATDSCGDCEHFNGQNHCEKFDADVTPNEVCDAFEEAGQEDEPQSDDEAPSSDAGRPE